MLLRSSPSSRAMRRLDQPLPTNSTMKRHHQERHRIPVPDPSPHLFDADDERLVEPWQIVSRHFKLSHVLGKSDERRSAGSCPRGGAAPAPLPPNTFHHDRKNHAVDAERKSL